MEFHTINIVAGEQVLRAIALQIAIAHGDDDILSAANRYYVWMHGR